MPRQMIHSSNTMDYHIDTHDGVEMISRYYLFYQLISEELSEDRAQFLAEPVKNQDRNWINWYTNLPGSVVHYRDLNPTDQRFAREVLVERGQEIKDLASRLLHSSARNRKLAGELLLSLFNRPADCEVYLVGGRPVVVSWGLSSMASVRGGSSESQALSSQLTERSSGNHPRAASGWPFPLEPEPPAPPAPPEPVAPPPPDPPAPVETTPVAAPSPPPVVRTVSEVIPVAQPSIWDHNLFKMFAGLLLTFVLLTLAFFIFFPGLRVFFDQTINPSAVDTAAFDRNSAEEEALRQELERLRALYDRNLAACPVEKPPEKAPETPEPPVTPPAEPAPEPTPEPVPEPFEDQEPEDKEPEDQPEEPKPEPTGELEIPEDAYKKNDVSFMEGCWESRAEGLISVVTKLPIVIKYCFNRKGNAVVTVDEHKANGDFYQTCSTTALANFEKKALVIRQRTGPICPKDKSKYSTSVMICSPKESEGQSVAICVIQQPDSPNITSNFRRVE